MRITLLFLLTLVSGCLAGQIPVEYWRDHFPYQNAENVISTSEKVYCKANGSLFYYNKKDGSVNKLSKVAGLSDVNLSAINYHEELNMLVIGYENGNIDLLDETGVFNIGAIERKTIPGSKKINNIYIHENNAFLSTDFAIVVINLENKEIKDTYYIGDNGEKTRIVDITADDQKIYALKEDAVMIADLNSSFLIDFSQWKPSYPIAYENAVYSHIENFAGNIFISLSVEGNRNDTLYRIANNKLSIVDLGFEADYYNLKAKNNLLFVSRTWACVVYNTQLAVQTMLSASTPKDADLDEDKTGWIAAHNAGLIRIEGYQRDTIKPDGPLNKGSYYFQFAHDDLWVAGGTPSLRYSQYGLHRFSGDKWKTFDYTSDTSFNKILNISKIAIDPQDKNHIYGGSFGYGLVEFRNEKIVKIFNTDNSILLPVEGYEENINKNYYLRINGMGYDSKGNLFIALSESKNPFYVLTTDGELHALKFNYQGFGIKTYIYDILVTSNDQVWVLMKNDGIFIFDINGTPDDQSDDQERKINVVNQDGESRNDVVSIAEDLDNNIWVGTGNGPIYYHYDDIFEETSPSGYQVLVPDIESNVQYLLVNDRITSIAVDGANRKWFGTELSGAYLVSSDGYNTIYNFRKETHPLPSNAINSVGINHNSGEVFFATDYGMVSFRAGATKAGDTFGNVYVFPNPVKSGYEGKITVTGLVNNANVKITDISGNMVYETTALGGQAIWDGKNFDGERVHTGVYLVFCSNDDGSQTYVTKMVFIH